MLFNKKSNMKGKYLIKINMVTQIMTSHTPAHLGFTANKRPFRPTKLVLKALKKYWVFKKEPSKEPKKLPT